MATLKPKAAFASPVGVAPKAAFASPAATASTNGSSYGGLGAAPKPAAANGGSSSSTSSSASSSSGAAPAVRPLLWKTPPSMPTLPAKFHGLDALSIKAREQLFFYHAYKPIGKVAKA